METHQCGGHGSTSVHQNFDEMDFERGLWYAAQHNDLERVEYLLTTKRRPVDEEDAAGYTPLHYAARHGRLAVCEILLQNGAKVDTRTRSGRATTLHRAATQGYAAIVQLLLENGANTDLQDADGATALHRAIRSKSFDVCNILATRTNPDLVDNRNRTPLALALEIGDERIVELVSKID